MKIEEVLTWERLTELLTYYPEDGIWKWNISRGTRRAGAIAGGLSVTNGYRRINIKIDKRLYNAARLAWFYMKKIWPYPEIDHENTDSIDNRWCNLREATGSQNCANKNKIIDNGLPKGVIKRGDKYCPYIKVKQKWMHLGSYRTPEEAKEIRDEAAKKYFGEFARS